MVRDSLGRTESSKVTPDANTAFFESREDVRQRAEDALARIEADRSGLVDQFAKAGADIGWQVHRCETAEDAVAAVVEICRNAGAKTGLRSEHDVFERVLVDDALRQSGVDIQPATAQSDETSDPDRASLRAKSFQVDVGITGVDFAIAETGSVAMLSRKGVSRLVSLAPPRHIAVVEASDVIPSLDEMFLFGRENFLEEWHRGMVNLISGPSRSADIEARTTTGVHGPGEVHLVILG